MWPWPFDLWVNACQVTAIEYVCTKFGVDGSSRFPVRARTNSQTDRHDWTPYPSALNYGADKMSRWHPYSDTGASHMTICQYKHLTTASKTWWTPVNYYLLFVKSFKRFAPDFKESRTFMWTHQSPVLIILDTSHEQIRDPQTHKQVSSPMLFHSSVLPDIKKLENVRMPWLQINGKCSWPLKYLTSSQFKSAISWK